MRAFLSAALAITGILGPGTSEAAGGSAERPDIIPACTSFDARTEHWGTLEVNPFNPSGDCPAGTAIVYHSALLGPARAPERLPLSGSCCPVPPNSLRPVVHFASGSCPEGSVVTGATVKSNGSSIGPNDLTYELKCTEIDTSRFHLGDPREPIDLEHGVRTDFKRTGGSFRLGSSDWSVIPSGWRYGIGRQSKTTWSTSGCVGYPWGSVMTAMGTSGCHTFQFREILRNTTDGSPAPKPVVCSGLVNLNDPSGECVLDGGIQARQQARQPDTSEGSANR